jgi:NADPH:quinone reductase-like Zn-dependent oxidoreductase
MNAAWFEEFGPAKEVLAVGEQTQPEPQAGEVLVRLRTSGVNPSDVKKRAGAFPDLLDDGLVVPHSDGAGIIEAVGAGVADREVGERVWVYQAQYGRRFGTAAEYVSIDSRRAPQLPDNVNFEIGACLGIPVMTAHRCVFADGPVDDQTILVTGGAGRVGHYAIQWACQAGATVIATASCPDDDRACIEAGAKAAVNHRQPGWCNEVLKITGQRKVDRVIDVEFGANLPEVLNLTRTGGTIATYSSTQVPEPKLPFLKMMFMDLTMRLVIVYAMPEEAKQQAIADIEKALRDERLHHRIAHVLPLTEIADAHEIIEQGECRGCVILKTAESWPWRR